MSTHIKITYAPKWSKGIWEVGDKSGTIIYQGSPRPNLIRIVAAILRPNIEEQKANAELCSVAPEMADYLWEFLQWKDRDCEQGQSSMMFPAEKFELVKETTAYKLLTRAKALTVEACDENGGVS